jgi:hypothetical protein
MDSFRRTLAGTARDLPGQARPFTSLNPFHSPVHRPGPGLALATVAAAVGLVWWIIATAPWPIGFVLAVSAAAAWSHWLSDEPAARGAANRRDAC